METIKTLLGYATEKTAMQRGKITNGINNKLVQFTLVEGQTVITNYVTYIAYRILVNKCIPDVITETEGFRYEYFCGKRERTWGKLDKPKYTYCLNIPGENGRFYEVNKSQYVFAVWIKENFNSYENAITADKAILEKEKQEQEAAERAEREAEERKQREEKERENFKRECAEIAMQYIETPLMSSAISIAEKYLPHEISELDMKRTAARFLEVYVYADKIENPLARYELKEWLHTGNKASPKCFEVWTGLKLPKTNKERIIFFDSLKRSDFELMSVNG